MSFLGNICVIYSLLKVWSKKPYHESKTDLFDYSGIATYDHLFIRNFVSVCR